MRSGLEMPLGCTIRVEYDPGQEVASATVTAYREGQWPGELSMAPSLIDEPGLPQRVANILTKRGVRR
jgi:hypothetical protein